MYKKFLWRQVGWLAGWLLCRGWQSDFTLDVVAMQALWRHLVAHPAALVGASAAAAADDVAVNVLDATK